MSVALCHSGCFSAREKGSLKSNREHSYAAAHSARLERVLPLRFYAIGPRMSPWDDTGRSHEPNANFSEVFLRREPKVLNGAFARGDRLCRVSASIASRSSCVVVVRGSRV